MLDVNSIVSKAQTMTVPQLPDSPQKGDANAKPAEPSIFDKAGSGESAIS